MAKKKRMMWLDIAKGLAIILMVLGHCLSDQTALHDFIYSFHMPLFFLAAGFTMRAKPRDVVVKSSARRLLVPYFVVCGILFAFAFVQPHMVNASLDTQRPWYVVLVEIMYAAGDQGDFFGHHYQAIGALWFLPCLFVARIILNEILLRGQQVEALAMGDSAESAPLARPSRFVQLARRMQRSLPALLRTFLGVRPQLAQPLFESACVGATLIAGIAIGSVVRLPFDIDTAMVCTLFMYAGVLTKRYDLMHAPLAFWLVIAAAWLSYPVLGTSEIAEQAYVQQPTSLITAIAGSLMVMKGCMLLERLNLSVLNRGLAWYGITSLYVLCVHRVESAVFNWQKIMEFFRPDVWSWDLTLQGLYWFGLRIALVLAATIVVNYLIKAGSRAWHARRDCAPAAPSDKQPQRMAA
jgi:fucose 4-O-acetylase-like acetyltransferase